MFARQGAGELNFSLDSVDFSNFGLALRAIGGVNFRMVQRNRYLLQRPALSSRIERDGHRRARAERGQKKIVGRRPDVGPAESDRLIAFEMMWTDFDFLGKPGAAAADYHVRRTVRSVGCHRWEQQ